MEPSESIKDEEKPKLFGKYHELTLLFVGFLLTTVLGSALALGIWLVQRDLQKRDAGEAFTRERRAVQTDRQAQLLTDSLRQEAEKREASSRQEAEKREARASIRAQFIQDSLLRLAEMRQADFALRRELAFRREEATVERTSRLRERELERAASVFDRVSGLLDRRLYAMRRILWAYQDGLPQVEVENRWTSYQNIVYEWNGSLNNNAALIDRYFGSALREQFLGQLSQGYRCIHNLLLNRRPATANRIHSGLHSIEGSLNLLNQETYGFNVRMTELIQRERVGLLSGMPLNNPLFDASASPASEESASVDWAACGQSRDDVPYSPAPDVEP